MNNRPEPRKFNVIDNQIQFVDCNCPADYQVTIQLKHEGLDIIITKLKDKITNEQVLEAHNLFLDYINTKFAEMKEALKTKHTIN